MDHVHPFSMAICWHHQRLITSRPGEVDRKDTKLLSRPEKYATPTNQLGRHGGDLRSCRYPLVMLLSFGKWRKSEFSNEKWWCCIVVLVYQRVLVRCIIDVLSIEIWWFSMDIPDVSVLEGCLRWFNLCGTMIPTFPSFLGSCWKVQTDQIWPRPYLDFNFQLLIVQCK